MSDETRRGRVLQNILAMAVLGGGMPIGLGMPREALGIGLLPVDLPGGGTGLLRTERLAVAGLALRGLGNPYGRYREATASAKKKAPRSAHAAERRKKRQAARRARSRR